MLQMRISSFCKVGVMLVPVTLSTGSSIVEMMTATAATTISSRPRKMKTAADFFCFIGVFSFTCLRVVGQCEVCLKTF